MYLLLCIEHLEGELEDYRVRLASFLNRSTPFGATLCEVFRSGNELHLVFHCRDHDLLFLSHFQGFSYRIEIMEKEEDNINFEF